jgi:hypothetical protein
MNAAMPRTHAGAGFGNVEGEMRGPQAMFAPRQMEFAILTEHPKQFRFGNLLFSPTKALDDLSSVQRQRDLKCWAEPKPTHVALFSPGWLRIYPIEWALFYLDFG